MVLLHITNHLTEIFLIFQDFFKNISLGKKSPYKLIPAKGWQYATRQSWQECGVHFF